MPNTESTIINTLPKMPFHFIPQTDSHLTAQIHLASQAFSKVNIAAARNTALVKLEGQGEKNLPKKNIKNPQVGVFLNPEDQAHTSNEFKALEEEYIKLQQLRANHSMTGYVRTVEKTARNIDKKFSEFLRKEKEVFHKNYAEACPNEGKRKELWEMYARNLKKNIQQPLEQFTKDIDNLVPQALIHYVNQLGKKNPDFAKHLAGKADEKLERKLQYTDSKGKPIIITKDKKTGEPSEIRVDPMSSLFGSSGDIGDAYAILAAYHGKDVPIRVVVPVFEDDNIYTEMKDFIALLIFLIFASLYKYLEKNHYREQVKQAALDKGISLENITLVDTRGNPLVFSEKDKAEINKKLQALERNHLDALNPEKEKESQNQLSFQSPTTA